MAATLVFSESNGAGETVTDSIANINFGSVDTPNIVATAHPILIGTASVVKLIRIKVTDFGGSTTISGLCFYKSSGAYKAGEQIVTTATAAANQFEWNVDGHKITYSTPSSAHFQLYNGITHAMRDPWLENTLAQVSMATAADNNVMIKNAHAGTLDSVDGANQYSDYTSLQLATDWLTNPGSPPPPAGAVNQKVFTLQYSEV